MNVLANNNELLKYIEIWSKIPSLFNEIAHNGIALNKKRFHSKPVCNEQIRAQISSYNKNFRDFKKLTKDNYCGHSILLLDSIVKSKINIILKKFLDKFSECNSGERHNKNNLFKELPQIIDWSDDESSNESNGKF